MAIKRLETGTCHGCKRVFPLHLLDAKPPHRDDPNFTVICCRECYGEPEAAVGDGEYIKLTWEPCHPSYVSDQEE